MRALSITFAVGLLLATLLAGCGGDSADPTATPLPPSPTPVPPTPTPVIVDMSTILDDFLIGARAVALEEFGGELSADAWTYSAGSVTTSQGEAQVTGVVDWGSQLYRTDAVTEGSAIMVRVRSDVDAEFGVYVESSAWGTPEYKRFGSYGPYPETNIFHGVTSEPRQDFAGELVIVPDVWYEMLIAIGPGGEFLALIWDPTDPTLSLSYQRVVDQGWVGARWLWGITANSGFLWLDDFTVLAFDGFVN